MRHCYHVEGLTDLAVIRDQANVRTKPNNKFTGTIPENTIIHLHKHAEPCDPSTVSHEFYTVEGYSREDFASAFWTTKENK